MKKQINFEVVWEIVGDSGHAVQPVHLNTEVLDI